jgi:DNA-binding NarL/FixJ family response regulator
VLSQQKDLACCGQAETVHETFTTVRAHRPDLVILDLRLKNGDGLELIKSLNINQL